MIQYDPISPVTNKIPQQYAKTQYADPLTKFYPESQGFETESGHESGHDSGQFDQQGSGINWIAAIAQVIGNVFNYFAQRKLQKDQQQFQYDYFDYTSNKQNAEYWKRVEYDTPFRQLQRFKDAGLSEALMYGTLGNAAGVSGNAPSSSLGGMAGSIPTALPYFDTSSVIQAMLAPAQVMSQIGLNSSQAYKNYKSAGVDDAQATRLSLLTPYEVEKYQSDIDYVITQTGKAAAEIHSLDVDNWVKDVSMGILAHIKEEELKLLQAQVYATRQKGDYDHAAKLRMDKEKDIVLPALAKSYNASAAEKWQNAARMEQTLDDYKKEMKARANVSEDEAESYFYREVLPVYLDLGIDVSQMIISRGLSIRGQNINAPRNETRHETWYNSKGDITSSRYSKTLRD